MPLQTSKYRGVIPEKCCKTCRHNVERHWCKQHDSKLTLCVRSSVCDDWEPRSTKEVVG